MRYLAVSGRSRQACTEQAQIGCQPGVAHHHVFFGNPVVDAYATVADLADTDRTTCDGGTLNRSAYWVPALYDRRGERIEYVEPLFYYKTGYNVPASVIDPPPEGLQMIAGHAHATEPQGTHVVKLRCAAWQSDRAWFDPGDPLDHVDYLPDCGEDDLLEVRVVFPQCWDGKTCPRRITGATWLIRAKLCRPQPAPVAAPRRTPSPSRKSPTISQSR